MGYNTIVKLASISEKYKVIPSYYVLNKSLLEINLQFFLRVFYLKSNTFLTRDFKVLFGLLQSFLTIAGQISNCCTNCKCLS